MKHGYWLWLLLLVLLTPALAQESSTETPPPTETASATVVPTIEPSPIPTATVEPIPTTTELPSASPTDAPSATLMPTEMPSLTSTVTDIPSVTPAFTEVPGTPPTATLELTYTPGVTPTASETLLGPETTETVEITPTETASPTETETATLTMTLSETPEATATSSATATATTVPMQPVFVETFESAYPNSWVRGPNSDVVFTLNPSNGSLLVTNDVVYPRELILANTRMTFQFKRWSGALSVGLRNSSMGMYRVAVGASELRVYRNEVLVATAVHTMNLVDWALMSIELVDGRMLVTLNHMPMLEWMDANPLPGGEIQFAAWADLTGSVSSFQIDNVLIESDLALLPVARAATLLSSSYEPLPLSNGEYLIFTEIYNERSVIVARAQDGITRYLLSDTTYNSGKPRVSPDGEWLAFLSDRNGGNNLFVMRLDGTELKQLTFSGGIDDMSWSPDSTQIVYRPSFDGYVPTRLVIIDLATEQEQVVNIAVDATLWNYSHSVVKWSPDPGRYITTAIVAQASAPGCPDHACGLGWSYRALWMVRLDLSGNTQTSFSYGGDGGDAYTGNNKGFAWLPDSSGYYFTRQENEDLWTMDIDGNWLSQLTNTTYTPCPNSGALDAAEIDPILSYDGTQVIYVKRTIDCGPPGSFSDDYWQMNADGDLHDSLGISYTDAVIHGFHYLAWPGIDVPGGLTLTLDVDAERLSPDHPVGDLYTFNLGERIPVLVEIESVSNQHNGATIRLELTVPRELHPTGISVPIEEQTELDLLISILLEILDAIDPDLSELVSDILGIQVDEEQVTFIYDFERVLMPYQPIQIDLEVVGQIVGSFAISARAYTLDESGTGQAMMLSGRETGMQQVDPEVTPAVEIPLSVIAPFCDAIVDTGEEGVSNGSNLNVRRGVFLDSHVLGTFADGIPDADNPAKIVPQQIQILGLFYDDSTQVLVSGISQSEANLGVEITGWVSRISLRPKPGAETPLNACLGTLPLFDASRNRIEGRTGADLNPPDPPPPPPPLADIPDGLVGLDMSLDIQLKRTGWLSLSPLLQVNQNGTVLNGRNNRVLPHYHELVIKATLTNNSGVDLIPLAPGEERTSPGEFMPGYEGGYVEFGPVLVFDSWNGTAVWEPFVIERDDPTLVYIPTSASGYDRLQSSIDNQVIWPLNKFLGDRRLQAGSSVSREFMVRVKSIVVPQAPEEIRFAAIVYTNETMGGSLRFTLEDVPHTYLDFNHINNYLTIDPARPTDYLQALMFWATWNESSEGRWLTYDPLEPGDPYHHSEGNCSTEPGYPAVNTTGSPVQITRLEHDCFDYSYLFARTMLNAMSQRERRFGTGDFSVQAQYFFGNFSSSIGDKEYLIWTSTEDFWPTLGQLQSHPGGRRGSNTLVSYADVFDLGHDVRAEWLALLIGNIERHRRNIPEADRSARESLWLNVSDHINAAIQQAIDDFEDINASDRTNGAFHLLAANLRGATIGGLSLPGVEDPDPVLLRSSYLDHIGVIRTQYGPERDAVLQPLVRREFNNDMTQIIGFRWITAVYQQASDRRYIDPERPPVVFDQNN